MPAAANLASLTPKTGDIAPPATPGAAEWFASLVAGAAVAEPASDVSAEEVLADATTLPEEPSGGNDGAALSEVATLLPLIEQQRAAVPSPAGERIAPPTVGTNDSANDRSISHIVAAPSTAPASPVAKAAQSIAPARDPAIPAATPEASQGKRTAAKNAPKVDETIPKSAPETARARTEGKAVAAKATSTNDPQTIVAKTGATPPPKARAGAGAEFALRAPDEPTSPITGAGRSTAGALRAAKAVPTAPAEKSPAASTPADAAAPAVRQTTSSPAVQRPVFDGRPADFGGTVRVADVSAKVSIVEASPAGVNVSSDPISPENPIVPTTAKASVTGAEHERAPGIDTKPSPATGNTGAVEEAGQEAAVTDRVRIAPSPLRLTNVATPPSTAAPAPQLIQAAPRPVAKSAPVSATEPETVSASATTISSAASTVAGKGQPKETGVEIGSVPSAPGTTVQLQPGKVEQTVRQFTAARNEPPSDRPSAPVPQAVEPAPTTQALADKASATTSSERQASAPLTPAGQLAAPAAPEGPVQASASERPIVAPLAAGPQPIAPIATQLSAPTAANLPASFSEQVLDLTRDGAWIDTLARDISKASSADGTMRFRLAPETLGELRVEILQSDRGAHVRLQVTSEAAQQALAEAQPKLAAEARAQGVRIAETEVTLTGGQSDGREAGRQAQAQSQSQSDQPQRAFRGHHGATNSHRAATPSHAESPGSRNDRYA